MKDWQISEELSAKLYGKKTISSGSSPFSKMDIIGLNKYTGFRGENKFTDKNSFILKLEVLEKGIKQAIQMMCSPFWVIDFQGKKRFIILEEEEFRNLMENK